MKTKITLLAMGAFVATFGSTIVVEAVELEAEHPGYRYFPFMGSLTIDPYDKEGTPTGDGNGSYRGAEANAVLNISIPILEITDLALPTRIAANEDLDGEGNGTFWATLNHENPGELEFHIAGVREKISDTLTKYTRQFGGAFWKTQFEGAGLLATERFDVTTNTNGEFVSSTDSVIEGFLIVPGNIDFAPSEGLSSLPPLGSFAELPSEFGMERHAFAGTDLLRIYDQTPDDVWWDWLLSIEDLSISDLGITFHAILKGGSTWAKKPILATNEIRPIDGQPWGAQAYYAIGGTIPETGEAISYADYFGVLWDGPFTGCLIRLTGRHIGPNVNSGQEISGDILVPEYVDIGPVPCPGCPELPAVHPGYRYLPFTGSLAIDPYDKPGTITPNGYRDREANADLTLSIPLLREGPYPPFRMRIVANKDDDGDGNVTFWATLTLRNLPGYMEFRIAGLNKKKSDTLTIHNRQFGGRFWETPLAGAGLLGTEVITVTTNADGEIESTDSAVKGFLIVPGYVDFAPFGSKPEEELPTLKPYSAVPEGMDLKAYPFESILGDYETIDGETFADLIMSLDDPAFGVVELTAVGTVEEKTDFGALLTHVAIPHGSRSKSEIWGSTVGHSMRGLIKETDDRIAYVESFGPHWAGPLAGQLLFIQETQTVAGREIVGVALAPIEPLIGGTPIPGLPGWFVSEWFGFYNTDLAPWLFHGQHGFVFHDPDSSNDSTFFYDHRMQTWWWTSEESYPFIYAFDPKADLSGTKIEDAWLFYFEDTIAPLEDTIAPRIFAIVSGPRAGEYLYFDP